MTDGLRTFEGAVAIVTGAASGIGKAIAEALASRGSAVVLTDIDHADAEAAASRIRERGGRASARHLDVTSAVEFDEVVNETVGRLGRLDYVFNNAGIGVGGRLASTRSKRGTGSWAST
jgi:NAD(P)-dependent dehydrogenase (short-subunit alcohol dehydrogenase family)